MKPYTWYIILLMWGAYLVASSSDMTLGGAIAMQWMEFGLMSPSTSVFSMRKIVNKAATPAPSECPTIFSRYLFIISQFTFLLATKYCRTFMFLKVDEQIGLHWRPPVSNPFGTHKLLQEGWNTSKASFLKLFTAWQVIFTVFFVDKNNPLVDKDNP